MGEEWSRQRKQRPRGWSVPGEFKEQGGLCDWSTVSELIEEGDRVDGREPCGLQRGHRLLLLFLLFFMKVKEESEKVGLKLNIQRTKIMAFSVITSWQIDGETMETVTDFILGALQNHCRW